MKLLKRILSSVNVVVVAVLLGVLFILVNHISSRRYARTDLTQSKLTALSDRTRQALASLEQPVTVIVFYQPSHRLYELLKDQLSEYQRLNPKVTVEYVDPDQDIARARQLVKEFDIDTTNPDALNQVIFSSGTRRKYLSDTDLAEFDYSAAAMGGQPRVTSLKTEEAFTGAIMGVTQTTQPRVWYVTGHGEKLLENAEQQGFADVKKTLEQQNLLVEAVTLAERTEIPADVKLVVIAGPSHRFAEHEVGLLGAYLNGGGGLLALIDPLDDTGLDPLLYQWGIELGKDIVVDPARQLPFVSAANVLVVEYSEHPIVSKMQTLMTLYPLVRSVRAVKPSPAGVTVTELAFTSDAGWGETLTTDKHFKFDPEQDVKGPVSIAAAAERPGEKKVRLVAIGDSEFAMNAQLTNLGNKDFFLGVIYWLTEQEQLIGIGPKPIGAMRLNLTGGQLTGIFWISFLGFPALFGGLGIAMWWIRRQ